MTDNRDEIVALAVEWAEDVLNEDGPLRYDSDQRRARGILAIASPPEPPKPKRFPGIDADPTISHVERGYIATFSIGKCRIETAWCKTSDEAVSAWNAMIDRIAGPDENVVAMVRDTIKCSDNCPACKKMWEEWLAERTGGAK